MVKKKQRTDTGNTMEKRKKERHRQYNEQKRQRTNTGHTMNKKDKEQTQAMQ